MQHDIWINGFIPKLERFSKFENLTVWDNLSYEMFSIENLFTIGKRPHFVKFLKIAYIRSMKARTTRFAGVILCLLWISVFCSCKKHKTIEEKVYEPSFLNKYFEDNILNRDITISMAKFEGRDTTPMYSGYVFRLLKNTYYDGPFQAKLNDSTYTGTWQCNEDYSKITLNIKNTGALQWVSISWKFTNKTTTVLEMIPWFNTDGDRYVKFLK